MNAPAKLQLQLNTETTLVDAKSPSERALEIRLTAPAKHAQEVRHALNLAIILDRSGSMSGEKLAYVKQAALHVLDQLGDGDRVSVIAFDDRVTTVAESTLLTPREKEKVKHLVQGIRSGGSTDLASGWLTGCEQVAKHLQEGANRVHRALLLTDGQANVGITDVEELAVHARELADRGVSTSTFGVGEGFNEQLLEVMANNGGGNFYFIMSPADIPNIFAQEFNELMAITARDVEISLELPEQVDLPGQVDLLRQVNAKVLGSWRTEKVGQGCQRISLGSLGAGQEKNIYVNLQFPPAEEGRQAAVAVTARGRGEHEAILESQAQLVYTYASPEQVQAAEVDHDLLKRAADARMSEATREALELERKGQVAAAAGRVRDAMHANANHLDMPSQRIYASMADRMQRGMDELDRKQSHYQSYLQRKGRADPTFQSRMGAGDGASGVLLRQLLRDRIVRLQDAPWLWQAPAALPAGFHIERVEGMLLGLAIGDALGNTSEGMLPAKRQAAFGEVRDYLPNRHAGDARVGLPSDDTQMAFWTVEVLLQEGRLNPNRLAWRFAQERIYGIGATVKDFLRAYKDQGRPWERSGQESAGNGAVMRIAPVLLPYLRRPSEDLWADAVLAGMVTHNDFASNAACAALVGMLWELLAMPSAPAAEWWGETFYRLAAPLEGKTSYASGMPGVSYHGSIAAFTAKSVAQALQQNWTTLQAAETWGSGAYLLETLPSALYILARHAGNPEEAIVRAVNDTKDNDTVAAIVGAAVGALHGKSALPDRWVQGLLGRTNEHNDGHIFQLIGQAKMLFG